MNNKPFFTKPSVMLRALAHEAEAIRAQLAMKPETLRANLAAVERLIQIFKPRAEMSAKDAQPKTLKAAAKLRAEVNGNGNGATRPEKPHHPNTKSPADIRASRLKTAALLRKFKPGEEFQMTGRDVQKAAVATLIRHGYISRRGDGYVRTHKEFHAER